MRELVYYTPYSGDLALCRSTGRSRKLAEREQISICRSPSKTGGIGSDEASLKRLYHPLAQESLESRIAENYNREGQKVGAVKATVEECLD